MSRSCLCETDGIQLACGLDQTWSWLELVTSTTPAGMGPSVRAALQPPGFLVLDQPLPYDPTSHLP